MSKFIKEEFNYHGGYLTYGADHKFIARFKYQKGDKPSFLRFLIANFTPEEYFARYANGESPLGILESKGFVLPRIQKYLTAKANSAIIAS